MSGDVWCGEGTDRMQDKAKVCGYGGVFHLHWTSVVTSVVATVVLSPLSVF